MNTRPPLYLFTTPRLPIDEGSLSEEASDDEDVELIKGETASDKSAARVKKNPKSQARPSAYSSRYQIISTKRRIQVSKSLSRSPDIDKNTYSSDFSSSGSVDISESQWSSNRTTQETTSFISSQEALRSRRESAWTPLALAILVMLTAICVGEHSTTEWLQSAF